MRIKTARFLLPTIALAMAAWAQPLPDGVRKGVSIEGITEYTFPNGLRVLLFPDPSNPKVTVNMTYLVGSRHEGYGETGMAHFLEHMLFIQTTRGRQIKTEPTSHGASWNGSTSSDRSNYYETFTASAENLRWALGPEADRMISSKMDKALLDTEMAVVRNEFERGENSLTRVLEERVIARAYLWHNYGEPTIGARTDIENVSIERLAAFYRKYYQPDNVVLAISEQSLIRYIANRAESGRTMKWDEQMEAAIQALTVEQINAAFRRRLDPSALSIVMEGDFPK